MKIDGKGHMWNWVLLLLGNVIGLCVVAHIYFSTEKCNSLCGKFSLSCHSSLFLGITLLTMLTTSLAAAPLMRFIHGGWYTRLEEFRNRLSSTSLRNYLVQYWEKMAVERKVIKRDADNKVVTFDEVAANKLFDEIYNQHYGKASFHIPTILLVSIVFVEAVLIMLAQAKIVTLYDNFPLNTFIAAVAGAYMFVVSDAVWQVRTRSLNVTDVYWYALRMLLAEPIAMTINGVSTTNQASTPTFAVAFAICFLPVDVLVKYIRRIATQAQGDKLTEKEVEDTLLNLSGVSVYVSSMLHAEGVNSIDQLIGMDPVLLSIRTGLPFKFVLNLISQAVVRRHMGNSVTRLTALDLTTCEQITAFVNAQIGNAQPGTSAANYTEILKQAVENINKGSADGQQVNEESLKLTFLNIRNDSFSRFLTGREN